MEKSLPHKSGIVVKIPPQVMNGSGTGKFFNKYQGHGLQKVNIPSLGVENATLQMAFDFPGIDEGFFRQEGGFANMETLCLRVEFAALRLRFDFRNIEPASFGIDVTPFLVGTSTF